MSDRIFDLDLICYDNCEQYFCNESPHSHQIKQLILESRYKLAINGFNPDTVVIYSKGYNLICEVFDRRYHIIDSRAIIISHHSLK